MNGKDAVRSVSVNVGELRRAIDETKTSAERTTSALIGFNQSVNAIRNVSDTVQQLANGLYQVISNGVPEDNWITYLEQSAKASVGGIADLEEAVKVTSTVIKNYGLSWDDAGTIQDKIQLTAKNGVTSFEP